MRPIINLDALVFSDRAPEHQPPPDTRQRFAARTAEVALRIGAAKLGYNVTEIPPGAAAFPFHCHHVNEEMFFILEGRGELRLGADRLPLRTGDFAACPPGDASSAHQIINTGTEPLRFLAVSSLLGPEICEYPDSGKFAVSEVEHRGAGGGFRHVGRLRDNVDYWEGE